MAETLTESRRPDLFALYEKPPRSAIGPASKRLQPKK